MKTIDFAFGLALSALALPTHAADPAMTAGDL
jgi:hypothetical protein